MKFRKKLKLMCYNSRCFSVLWIISSICKCTVTLLVTYSELLQHDPSDVKSVLGQLLLEQFPLG